MRRREAPGDVVRRRDARTLPGRFRGAAGIEFVKVVLSLQSCAFRGELRKLCWLSVRMAGDLVKIQNIDFLHWSNGISTILSLREFH